jgi:translation initiation factor eIF-2B subunit epsilon
MMYNICSYSGGLLKNDVVINENCSIDDDTILSNSVVGRNCKIGRLCNLTNCYIFNNVTIEDECTLNNCIIGNGVRVGANSKLTGGAILGDNVVLPSKSEISKEFVQNVVGEEGSKKLGASAYTIPDETADADNSDVDSDEEDENVPEKVVRLGSLANIKDYASSVYSSSSDDDDDSEHVPVLDDSNSELWLEVKAYNVIINWFFSSSLVFFTEVMESLKRGYEEKTDAEFLILEINSSRYAYNIGLSEVNFLVMKAIFSFPVFQDNDSNIISSLASLLKYFSKVITNYIRGNEAMQNCLKAFEECCEENAALQDKSAKCIHFMYDKEVIDEDAILEWHQHLENDVLKSSLAKLVDWLQQSSEDENTSSEDDDD